MISRPIVSPLVLGLRGPGLTDAERGFLAEQSSSAIAAAARAELAAKAVAISAEARTFTVGAPLSLLSAVNGVANPGTWYSDLPVVQTGTVRKLRCKVSGINVARFVFGTLRADSSGIDDVFSLPFQTVAGDNVFIAEQDFEPFTVPEGMYFGVETDVGLIYYSRLGSNFYRDPSGVFTANGDITLSASAEIVAEEQMQSVAAAKDPRVVLYDVRFDQDSAPLRWTNTPGVEYSAQGMELALPAGGDSWQNPAVFSHHPIMCDKLVVRAEWEHTTPGSIYGIGAARDLLLPTQPDTTALNSLFVIDTSRADRPADLMYQMFSQFYTNPGAIIAGPNGLNSDLAVGDIITQEIKLDYGKFTYNTYNQTKAALGDQIVTGDAEAPSNFGVQGLFVPYVSAHFRKGNARLRRVTLLLDAPAVDIFFAGDSMTKAAPPDGTVHQSYVGLVEADGYRVARCAAPGWTSHGIVNAAINMMRKVRPVRAMFAGGTNDYNQNVPVADFKWNVARFIDEARRAGVKKIALAILHPIPDRGNDAGNGIVLPGINPYNQAIFDLAAGQSDIFLVRWDLALTVNADGVHPDVTKLFEDRQHQIAKGELAKYQALRFGPAAGFLD